MIQAALKGFEDVVTYLNVLKTYEPEEWEESWKR
jgi:hypothetical protein